MKFLLSFLLLITITCSLNAQGGSSMVKPPSMLDSRPGYITLNDLTTGVGLSKINAPFSSAYYGFTTLHGYQVDSRFIIAGGTGLLFYNEGTLIPLMADIRYSYYHTYSFTSYFFGDGGFLFNTKGGVSENKLFANPGVGFRYDFNHNFAGNFGIGLWVQKGTHQDSFINFKLGFTLLPKKK